MIRHNSLVLTHDDLAAAVRVLEQYDEFAIDTETVPTPRDDGELVDKDALDTRRNRVIWVSLGAPGFGCSIPIGHPNGDVILPKRTVKVYEPTGEKLKSGDEKLKARSETRPPVFDTPPKQLQRTAVFQTLKPLLWSDRRKVGHNIKFDMKSIAKYYDGSIPPGPYGDTAAAFRLVDDNYPTDRLKPVLKKIFGYVYEQFGKRITEASIFDGGTYAYNDAYYTWLLWDWCVRLIDALDLRAVLDLDMDCLPVLAKAEYRGIRIDTDQLQALNLRLDQEIDAALVQLYTDAGRKQWNPNADAEVAWFVYEHCNNPVTVRTKKTQAPSTAKGTIEKIAAKDERVQHILDYRELDKMRGTYVRAIAERLNNGIIGTSFKIAGAATGRLSSTQPNLQNVPTPDDDPRGLGTVIRGMFIPRDGHRFVVCDYSAIEYRVMADMSGDKEYARMFESGEDPHVETAATLFGVESVDVSKKQRGIAKNCVPLDTEILTSDGWKRHDEVREGDLTLTHNGWEPVLKVVHWDDEEVLRLSTATWEARVTPEHKWIGERRTGRGPTRRWVPEIIYSNNISSEHRMFIAPQSATGDPPDTIDITPREAAIIAFLYGDGSIRWSQKSGAGWGSTSSSNGAKRGLQAVIYQSKPEGVGYVDELFRDGEIRRRAERPDRPGDVVWSLAPAFIRPLLRKAGLEDGGSVEALVLRLTAEARAAFVHSAMVAEGDTKTLTRFSQNEGDFLSAMRLAIYLEGYYVAGSARPAEASPNGFVNWLAIKSKPTVTGQKIVTESLGREPVWCVQTPSGTWTMRQGHRTMLTGNTGFALAYGAGVDKVASMSGVGVDEAQRVMDIHQATFPGLYEWIEDVKAAARQMRYPYFSTALGRRRRLPDLRFGDQWQRWRAERQGVNHVVQGTAAEIMKAALVNLGDMLESDMHLLLTVHDEVVVEAKTDCVDDCAKIVQKAMAGPKMQTLSVPLVAVPAIVDRWSDAK